MTNMFVAVPAVERIVYSTCSINQVENEDVVQSVLPLAESYGFELATVFPTWPRRGLRVFDGSEHLLRTDLSQDKEGFFIALFVRKGNHLKEKLSQRASQSTLKILGREKLHRKRKPVNYPFMNICRILLYSQVVRQKSIFHKERA